MENLGIDHKLIIAQIINFALLYFVFRRYIALPFIKKIQQEKEKEEEREKLLAIVSEQAKKIEAEKLRILEEHRKQAAAIIGEAKKQADDIKQKILLDAEKYATELVTKAKIQINEERSLLEKEMRNKMLSLSIMLVEKTLKQYLTDEMQKEIIRRLLSESSSSNQNYEN